MRDIKDFILQLEDTTLSLEEQQAALTMIEQSLIENKQIQEKTLEENSNLIVDAVKEVEKKLENRFIALTKDSTLKGAKGDKGINGKDGIDGKPGINGRDGRDGKDGVDGKDGEDGEQAPKIVDAEIAIDDTLLLTLSDGSQIKTTKQVVGERGSNGSNGATGSKGDAGVGIAVGGTTDQVLAKNSSTDYDTKWTTLGTMAQQNANAVTITGGTIDNTTIGATTPSTVNATTLSGETGVLRGTGQNLILQSQSIPTSPWNSSGLTATTNTGDTTAPDGTNTASKFSLNATSGIQKWTRQDQTSLSNTVVSVFLKAGTYGIVQIYAEGNSGNFCNFDINTGTVGTAGANATGSIVALANGWYRCIVVFGSIASGRVYISPVDSTSATFGATTTAVSVDFYGWGAQRELSSTANTYIPTTTTAVYGTPTLSFSGVSTIGLQSNGALFLQPAGTGAIQAQATTSTTAGGNVRGANAVDWQTSRNNANQVASNFYSVLSGGINNRSNGFGGGIVCGTNNTSNNSYAFVGSGNSNTADGEYSVVCGANSNQARGYYNFIGGGLLNSGTANAAVTTQATTAVTSSSTAVTLSATNANIKVGQYITGTGIATNTYVSAISTTSLTLSQNANATGTPTLSFFTPHGVVVGGGNNQATGSYSFIGGGGDAGTAANRNVASGDWSFVGGGFKNVASAVQSAILGGDNNTASGINSAILGGTTSTASNTSASVLGGNSNTANGAFSTVIGRYAIARGLTGSLAVAACNRPISANNGISQMSFIILGRQTTDATPTALCSDSSAASGSNQVILPNNSAYFFRGEVVSGVTGGGDTKGWTIEGVIKRGANAASTALVGAPTITSTYADAGASTWDIAVTADTTNGGIRVTFTGQAATTIRTVCRLNTVEMTF